MGVLGVTDEDFFTDPFRDRDGVLDRLEATDEVGVLLDAPSAVRLDLRDDVPLAGARRELLSTGVGAGFRARAALVVVRAESNEVRAGRLFAWKEPAVEPEPDAPLPDDETTARTAAVEPLLDAVMTDFFAASLRECVPDLAWREGTLRVTVLIDDDRSNTAVVQLRGAPGGDAAAEAFVARHRSPGYPRAVSPAGTSHRALPAYLPVSGSPPAPPVRGISMAVPARVSLAPEATCVVRGSFTLPVLAREVVRPFDAHDDRFGRLTGAGWVDVGDRDATAVLPVSLVITTDGVDAPAVLRLDVPVYAPVSPGASASGYFSVDLFELPEMPRQPGRYRVWALSGDVLVGPHALDLAP